MDLSVIEEYKDRPNVEIEIKYGKISKVDFDKVKDYFDLCGPNKYKVTLYSDDVRMITEGDKTRYELKKKLRRINLKNGMFLGIATETPADKTRGHSVHSRNIERYSKDLEHGHLDLSIINGREYECEIEYVGGDVQEFYKECKDVLRLIGDKSVIKLNNIFKRYSASSISYDLVSKPRDLLQRDLEDDGLWKGYAVSIKLTGFLKFLILDGERIVETDMKSYQIIKDGKRGDFSVYACEKMDDIYYAFDTLVFEGADVTKSNYIERVELIDRECPYIRPKRIFYEGDVFQNVRDAVKYGEELGLEDDGLVFTPIESPYITAGQQSRGNTYDRILSNYPDVCKWKPREKLSIDLKVLSLTSFRGNDGVFKGDNIRGVTKDHVGHVNEFFPIFEGENVFYEPKIIRHDKMEGNNLAVINGLMRLAKKNISLDTLMGKGIQLQRIYHNNIKGVLLDRSDATHIIDVGCGKGGDLSKWKHSRNLRKVFGIEPNEENLEEFRRRKQNVSMKASVDEIMSGGEDKDAYVKALEFLRPSKGDVLILNFMLSLSFFWDKDNSVMKKMLIENIKMVKNYCKERDVKFKLVFFSIEGERTSLQLYTHGNMKGSYELSRCGDTINVNIPESAIVHDQTEYLVDLKELWQEIGMYPKWSEYADRREFLNEEEKTFSSLFTYGICEMPKTESEIKFVSNSIDISSDGKLEDENEMGKIKEHIYGVKSIDAGHSLNHCILKAASSKYRMSTLKTKFKMAQKKLPKFNVYNSTTGEVLQKSKAKGGWICLGQNPDGSYYLLVAKHEDEVITRFDKYRDLI